MIKRVSKLVLMLVSLVLMFLPTGIRTISSGGPGVRFVNYYSYFSAMVFGYGNWLPLMTLVLTSVTIILLIINIKKSSLIRTINTLLLVCILMMTFSFIMFNSLTIISLLVTIIHGLVLMVDIFLKDKYQQ